MTIPDERLRSLKNMRPTLINLCTKKGPIKKIELRYTIKYLLKHYPSDHEIDLYWRETKCRSKSG